MAESNLDHEYLPIEGLKELRYEAARLILGDSPIFTDSNYACVQTLSGTGALRLGAEFLKKLVSDADVYVSDPTWRIQKLT